MKNEQFTCDISLESPTGQKGDITCTFLLCGRKKLTALIEEGDDQKFLQQILMKVENLTNEQGVALTHEESFDVIFDMNWLMGQISTQYIQRVHGLLEKN